MRLFLISFLVLILTTHSFALEPSKSSWKKARKQLKKMSLEEKAAQTVHIGVNARFLNRDNPRYKSRIEEIKRLKPGGVTVFAGGLYETTLLINRMQRASAVPLLISADFETGIGMRFNSAINFPWNMALGASQNLALAEKMGFRTGLEARAMGVHWVFAPVIDINNNAENPVINVRSFGESPEQVADLGNAFSRGLQRGRVIATAKHFPGHGDTNVDSHRGLPVIKKSREQLFENELFPFRELVRNKVGSVMVSHISLPSLDGEIAKPLKDPQLGDYAESAVKTEGTTVPATLSKPIVDGILKNDLGFEGIVATDAMDMNGLTLFYEPKEAAIRAILAGNDILIKPDSAEVTIAGVTEGARSGRIPMTVLDAAVLKQLAWKYELGLFESKEVALEGLDDAISSKETRDLSLEIAKQSITLVKNTGTVLPLSGGKKTLFLVITNGLDYVRVGRPFSRYLKANGITNTRIVVDSRSGAEEFEKLKTDIAAHDQIVVGLFGRVRTGSSRSVSLPDSGSKALNMVLDSEKPLAAIAFGNPYLLESFPRIPVYIVSWGDMDSLQWATAKAIAGKTQFNGKLPISVANHKLGYGLELPR